MATSVYSEKKTDHMQHSNYMCQRQWLYLDLLRNRFQNFVFDLHCIFLLFCSVHVGFLRRSEYSWVWISVGRYLLTDTYIAVLQINK